MSKCLTFSFLGFLVPEIRNLGPISPRWRWEHQWVQHAVVNIPRRNYVSIGHSTGFLPSNSRHRRHSSAFSSDEFGFDGELEFKEKLEVPFDLESDSSDLDKVDMDSSMRNGRVTVDTTDSSNFDFLENEEEKESKGISKEDDLVRLESEDELEKMGLKRGKQMMKRSNLMAKQVISIQSALSLGFISQLWVDPTSWAVLVVEIRPNLLSGESERFLLEDVMRVGDVVLVEDESVIENDFKMVGLETLLGYSVVTPGQRNFGKVRGYTFNINRGTVESLELDSFGISVIPSSVVSTYALLVEDILEVVSDTVVVDEAAVSRIQRLTKGFWDPQNVGSSAEDEHGEYYDLEELERFYKSRRKRRSRQSKKSGPKKRETGDDGGFPFDFL